MYFCHEDKGFVVDDLIGPKRSEVSGEKFVDHVEWFYNLDGGRVRLRGKGGGGEGE